MNTIFLYFLILIKYYVNISVLIKFAKYIQDNTCNNDFS